MADIEDLLRRLEAITEELGDLSIQKLKESIESGDPSLVAEERRIGKARRSVEKAAGILAGMPSEGSD